MHVKCVERGQTMRAYVRENLKPLLAVALLIMSTILLVGTKELVAQILPDVSRELTLYLCDMKEDKLDYTGEEITPEVRRLIFDDKFGNKVIKQADEIRIVKYVNNVEIGNADIKISVNGYKGTILIKDAFQIRPAKTMNLHITQATKENVDLAWDQAVGADGYAIYKSADNGKSYTVLQEIQGGDVTTYQDTDIQFNASYIYYVRTCMYQDEVAVYGGASDKITQQTPLATPVLSSVAQKSYNTIVLKWEAVDGAIGYQVYRSSADKNEFTCIAEINDGGTTTYSDTNCELGVRYAYYLKACRQIQDEKEYGEASETKAAHTTPNRVSLSGTTTDGDTAVTLKWKKSNGAHGYEVYRSTDNTKNYQLVKDIDQADTLSWSESGLNKDTYYYYKIRPYCIINGERITGSYSGVYEKVVTIVYSYEGIPEELAEITKYASGSTKVQYVWGGTSLSGWDCSGFTQWVYKNHFGIDIGRTAATQNTKGRAISKKNKADWQPGDILVYTEGAGASHVAIYLGDGKLIHALSTKYDTLIQDVDYFERWDRATSLMAVRRIFE